MGLSKGGGSCVGIAEDYPISYLNALASKIVKRKFPVQMRERRKKRQWQRTVQYFVVSNQDTDTLQLGRNLAFRVHNSKQQSGTTHDQFIQQINPTVHARRKFL